MSTLRVLITSPVKVGGRIIQPGPEPVELPEAVALEVVALGVAEPVEQAAPSVGEVDDLTRISGISAARAEHLAQLGILTYAQLADSSTVEVAAAIPRVSEEMVLGWQEQAQRMFIALDEA